MATIWKKNASSGVQALSFLYASWTVLASWVPNLRTTKQTMRPIMKTTMFAIEMVDPVMLFVIPGNPSTTASTMTSTMTPTTRRMKEGMTGVKAPQVLFEVVSVILLHLERLSPWELDIAMSKPEM